MKPNHFKLWLAALTAASTAVTATGNTYLIVVRPGSYTINTNLASNNINWYFEPGVIITSTEY